MTEDIGNGRVTMARLDERLKALNDKLDRYHAQICKELDATRQEGEDNDRRITSVEQRLVALETKGGVVAILATALASFIGVFVKP